MPWFLRVGVLVSVLIIGSSLAVRSSWASAAEAVTLENRVWSKDEALQRMKEFGECAGFYAAAADDVDGEKGKKVRLQLLRDESQRHEIAGAFMGFGHSNTAGVERFKEMEDAARVYYRGVFSDDENTMDEITQKNMACSTHSDLIGVILKKVFAEEVQ